eukprot:473347-Amphidinium_carterae.1
MNQLQRSQEGLATVLDCSAAAGASGCRTFLGPASQDTNSYNGSKNYVWDPGPHFIAKPTEMCQENPLPKSCVRSIEDWHFMQLVFDCFHFVQHSCDSANGLKAERRNPTPKK